MYIYLTPFPEGRELDDDVGLGAVEESVNTKPTDEEEKEFDKVYEFFLKLAGEDKEVDWMELKDILDYSLKSDRERKKIISIEPKKALKDLNEQITDIHLDDIALKKDLKSTKDSNLSLPEIPCQEVTTATSTAPNNDLFPSCFALFCGTICKGTPLGELFTPKVAETPLRAALTDLKVGGFSKDVCRSMISMLDTDRSGKLGFVEFKELWELIRQWKNVWMMYDTDKSGTFSGFELREALNSAGFRLNNKVLNILMHRYGNKTGEMDFEDFMMCAIKLKIMILLFLKKQLTGTNNATFSIDEWLENTLYS